MNKKEAEKLLKKLSRIDNQPDEVDSKKIIPMVNSKKPLWIDDVKRTCEGIIPQIDMKDLENTKEILEKGENEDMIVDYDEYPYFMTVKKLLYAFGDVYKNSQRTVLYIHDFIKRLLIILAKIITECDFKKILEHLYSYEYNKYYTYKKLKFKNNFEEGEEAKKEDNMFNEEGVFSFDEDLGDVEEVIKEVEVGGDNNDICDNEDQRYTSMLSQFKNENFTGPNLYMPIAKGINLSLSESPMKKNNKNYLQNIFEDKDENYFENLAFQDQRTSTMNHTEYLEYISCRQQTFLSKGKKTFLNYLQSILSNAFPHEFKDLSNLELISFLLKEILRKIITSAIKNKHPDNKLFIVNFPLLVDDIEDLCNTEIEKLDSFMSDFYVDIYLMKEFKKKKLSKNNNKNVKIKKNKGEFLIIIKKVIFLEDNNHIEFLRKNKKAAEEKVMNSLKILSNKYLEIIKILKRKDASAGLPINKITRGKKTKKKMDKLNEIKSIEEDIKKSIKLIYNYPTVLLQQLFINNYYEYYLIKNYLISEYNFEEKLLEPKLLIDEINVKINTIKKMNRRAMGNSFDAWLKMTSNERNYIIDQFNKFSKTENQFEFEDDAESKSNESVNEI